MRRLGLFLVPALLVAFMAVSFGPASAATPLPIATQCRNRIVNELTLVRDEARSYIFGSRRDEDGTFKVFTGGNDTRARKGIFETRERLTSELVVPLVESYKTYKCKSAAVCTMVAESIRRKGGTFEVDLLGCELQTLTRYDECFLAPQPGGSTDTEQGNLQDVGKIQSECDIFVEDSLAAERAILRLAVAYDTGYRSTLQFAGMMDWMMEDLPVRAIRPIRDMVNMLGKLHEIPCFIGQCDNPDTSGIVP